MSSTPIEATTSTGASLESEKPPLKPLNVKDALMYLDNVKQQFSDQQEVYDRFLTIMKDFKTQNIDTPGVIDRVSNLFRGYPILIVGFNTFLPPGYRIECSVSTADETGKGAGNNTITVTTPMGTTTRTQDIAGSEAKEVVTTKQEKPAATTTSQAQPATLNPERENAVAGTAFNAARGGTVYREIAAPALTRELSAGSRSRMNNPPVDPSLIPPPATALAAPPRTLGKPGDTLPVMEFNHAINYVNKIKTRFVKDPDTYKTFLEILQTYQKEARPIQEVYAQVTSLFHSAPDLLLEFKAFLPDVDDPERTFREQQRLVSTSLPPLPPLPMKSTAKKQQSKVSREETANAKAIALQKKAMTEEKKKRAAPGMGERAKAKRAKTTHPLLPTDLPPVPTSASKPDSRKQSLTHSDAGAFQSYHGPHSNAPPAPYGASPAGFPGAPRMQSAYDAYLANHRTPTLVQAEEFGFFDRVKKYLDDRATYTEFLKLLNLFTQEIIDVGTLLEKSLLFIGDSDELVGSFKELVGWDPVKDGRIEGEDWIIDNEPVLERPKVELHLMKSFGPSYRKLPDSEIDLACSGRDSLDWSVLNDEWVAFATWASEGSGAHRKNVYEDALYNSEQERHWYSFQIESNLRAIAHFEPIAARIIRMSVEERLAFRLEEGLGGSSPTIYERVVKKVYGRDQGNEIMGALYDNPAVAVPIVLARLKQKDEEWKRALREWNKVWREVDAKNFYRALDHQGVQFKAIDKKLTMTTKSLTTEIEQLRSNRSQKRLHLPNIVTPLRPTHQFELGLTDRAVLFDVLKLTFSFLDRDQSGYSGPERSRVEAFLRLFVPLLLGVPHAEMEANLAHSDEVAVEESDEDAAIRVATGAGTHADEHEHEHDEEVDSEAEGNATTNGGGTSDVESSDGARSPARRRNGVGASNKRGGDAEDLRKRLLVHAATAAGRSGTPSVGGGSRSGSPVRSEASVAGDMSWVQLDEIVGDEKIRAESGTAEGQVEEERRCSFFANTTCYCLVRIIHTLYSRLSDFKTQAAHLAETASADRRRLSPLAIDLGLTTPIAVIDEGPNPAAHYYEHALDLAEKLFEAEIDQSSYEESLRYMVGIKAYPLFTVDKLISTLIKHIHTINSDSRCQDLVALLEADRAKEFTNAKAQMNYRIEAEECLNPEELMYRIEWIPNSNVLTIQLLHKDDESLEEVDAKAMAHKEWMSSFLPAVSSQNVETQVTMDVEMTL